MSAKVIAMGVQSVNAARLTRTKGYPYGRPSSSFLYANGRPYIFEDAAWSSEVGQLTVTSPEGASERAGELLARCSIPWDAQEARTPVLAIGSNAGPEQLLRKFPPDLFPQGVAIPCVRCILLDFDVAYAPLLSSYGSCTATLERSEGTAVEVFVTFLTAPQLQRMHETEGAYLLNRLHGLTLHLGLSLEGFREGRSAASTLQTAYQYNHQSGTLHLPLASGGSSPVAIKEIRAHKRRFPALNQVQMQRAVRAYIAEQQQAKGSNGSGLGALDASRQNGCGNGAAASPCANGSTRAQVACQADATADVPPTEEDAAEVCAKQDGAGAAGETHLLDVDPGEVHVPESVLDAWILESLDEPDTRTARVDYLVVAARPLRYEHAEVLMTMGNVYDRNVE